MRNGAGPEGDKSRVVEAPTQGAEHTPSPDEDKPFVNRLRILSWTPPG